MIHYSTTVSNQDREDLKTFYDKLKSLPAGRYELFITDQKKSRSVKQRKYYWSVIVKIISDHTGYSTEETNEILKFKFNPKEVQEADGRWLKYGGSIENEKPARVEEIYASIRLWVAQTMDIQIPEPNELSNAQLIEIEV